MAFRIHESGVRGEIDNREKGIVRGRIWLTGRADPVVLELKGNAHPDLAGCILRFTNPLETLAHPHLDALDPVQQGTIGDLTASRKVRVFDVPLEEALTKIRRKAKPPEHMANSLYLEWFSEANGRVVIESADFQLEISAPLWQLTPEEEAQRATDSAAGMNAFMQKLTEAIEAQRHHAPENIEDWDEFEHEKALRESDAITDKYMELLDKYGDTPEAEALIAQEMGWRQADGAETEDEGGSGLDVDEINRICAEAEASPPEPDPLTEGVDWIRTEDGDVKHPLSQRAMESVLALMHALDALGLRGSNERDLIAFENEFQITGAKLAGALDSLAYDGAQPNAGFVTAYLKRALDHLHKAQASLEKVAPGKLLPEELVAQNRKELFEIRAEILRLMDHFRGRA